jgi:glycosyltransferase involved in cell wall biosynthesis
MNHPDFPHRILMTTDAVGGVWDYSLELCRGLRGHDISVVLATMGPRPRADQREAAQSLDHVTLCESEFRLEWMESPWGDVARAGDWLLSLEEEFAPDLVHLNGYAHGALPWRAPVLMVGHSCVLSWWEALHGEHAPAACERYREAATAGLRAASLVAAPTQTMLAALQRHYGPLAATTVIPNGRDSAQFACGPKREAFVLSVGRLWDEAKNVDALAAIAPELPWPVRVAGDATAPDGRRCEFAGLEMLGHCLRPALRQLYAQAAIYALPARYEPFGLSVLEAALSGCALVLGDIPSLRETWGGAAVFVKPNRPGDLRDAILTLIDDPLGRARLAACARARAAHFTPDRMTARYLAACRRVSSGHASGHRSLSLFA